MTWIEENTLFLSLPTQQLLALAAYGEAASEGAQGLMAVINVIANRTTSNEFMDSSILTATGDKYKAVMLKQYQFSCFNTTDPVRPKLISLAQTFNSSVMTNAALNQAYQLSGMLLQGVLTDNTSGATYYHAATIMPSWASIIPFIGQIGNHLFYGYKTLVSRAISSPLTTTMIIISIIGVTAYIIIRRSIK